MKNKIKGRWVKEFTDQQFINALHGNLNTPADIADIVGCGLSLAQKRLKILYKTGVISGQLVAGRWVYWSIADMDSKCDNNV